MALNVKKGDTVVVIAGKDKYFRLVRIIERAK